MYTCVKESYALTEENAWIHVLVQVTGSTQLGVFRFLDKEEHKAQIETLSQLNTDELKENLEKIGEGTPGASHRNHGLEKAGKGKKSRTKTKRRIRKRRHAVHCCIRTLTGKVRK
jgi:hypothetical protein